MIFEEVYGELNMRAHCIIFYPLAMRSRIFSAIANTTYHF
jgi:hypothetical protein